jgi:hypothetical protein
MDDVFWRILNDSAMEYLAGFYAGGADLDKEPRG